MKVLYSMAYLVCYMVSLLPFWILYRISDVLYIVFYYVMGYKRKIVRNNLRISFPHKEMNEIIAIEKKFYAFSVHVKKSHSGTDRWDMPETAGFRITVLAELMKE